MLDLDKLVQGSIDMHVHFGPDPLLPRRVDAVQVAVQAQNAGMKAVVLKSHSYPTAPLAHIAGQHAPDVSVFGSLCLDFEIGTFNPFAVEVSADLGAKMIWMPTLSAANCRAKVARSLAEIKGEGISILNSEGKLLSEVVDVLRIIKERNLVLATGHLSPAEIFTLVDESKRLGISKIVITHPLETSVVEATPTIEEQRSLAREGAFIEHCVFGLLPTHEDSTPPQQMVEAIRAVSAENCIMSTDLGQAHNPPPVEGMRIFISTLIRHGLTEEEVALMVKTNPARLLDLDVD